MTKSIRTALQKSANSIPAGAVDSTGHEVVGNNCSGISYSMSAEARSFCAITERAQTNIQEKSMCDFFLSFFHGIQVLCVRATLALLSSKSKEASEEGIELLWQYIKQTNSRSIT